MPTRSHLLVLAGLLLSCASFSVACQDPTASVPKLLEVLPAEGLDDRALRVTVKGEGFSVATRTDFGERGASSLSARYQLLLGEQRLEDVTFVDGATLEATVPSGLLPGAYPLTVVDPNGRTAALDDAFRVVAVEQADVRVVGYTFAAVAPQRVGVPFEITVTAVDAAGARVDGFNRSVPLSANDGAVRPASLGSFIRGVWTGPVELAQPGVGTVLTVNDDKGRSGASQPFAVLWPVPTQLAITFVPSTLPAGSCTGPYLVQPRDERGFGTTMTGAAQLTVDAAGAAAFFSDPGCTAPAGSVALGPGAGQFFLRAQRAGDAQLIAFAAGITSAAARVTVTPGPPTVLSFVTPPQTVMAGACSQRVELEVTDASGNPVSSSSPQLIALAANPTAGFGLFSDSGCSAATSSVSIPAGSSTGSFHFRGNTSQTVQVGALLGAIQATQTETVLPGPLAAIEFTSSPQTVTAGQCSGSAVNLLGRDVFGNIATAALDTPLLLSASPAAGVTFHGGAGCSAPANAIAVIAQGQSTTLFFFRGTLAGPVTLFADGGALGVPSYLATIEAAAPAGFTFDVLSTVTEGQPFPVSIHAQDTFGNDASFSGAAGLTVAPSGTATCATSCSGASTTASFVDGRWMGEVNLASAAGSGRTLTATSGTLTGTSNAFTVLPTGTVVRSPPKAVLTANPPTKPINVPLTLDASGSSDSETSTAALEVSFDFDGVTTAAPGTAPWTAFSTTKSFSRAYTTVGLRNARVAVRDADGDVTVTGLSVWITASAACRVTSGGADDGASDCTTGLGPDGALSFAEAVRLSNTINGTLDIEVPGPLDISAPTSFTFSDTVNLFAGPGVVLNGVSFAVVANNVVQMGSFQMTGATSVITLQDSSDLFLFGMRFTDFGGFSHSGRRLELSRSSLSGCAASPCLDMTASGKFLRLSDCELDGKSSGTFLDISGSGGAANVVPIFVGGSIFSRFSKAIILRADLGRGADLINNTFHGNDTAVEVLTGAKLNFRNNLFTANNVATVTGCANGAFTARDYHQLFQNVSDGCIGADPNVVTGDPLYVSAPMRDFRLQFASPAKDTGVDSGQDINDVAPGNFTGSAPDRGGEETW